MKISLLLIAAVCLITATLIGQTIHGMLLSWPPVVGAAGAKAIVGYNAYRAPFTTVCGTYEKINVSRIGALSYNDPASGLALSTTYCWYVNAVDSDGNESATHVPQIATTPAAWPITVPPGPVASLTVTIH